MCMQRTRKRTNENNNGKTYCSQCWLKGNGIGFPCLFVCVSCLVAIKIRLNWKGWAWYIHTVHARCWSKRFFLHCRIFTSTTKKKLLETRLSWNYCFFFMFEFALVFVFFRFFIELKFNEFQKKKRFQCYFSKKNHLKWMKQREWLCFNGEV